VGPTPGRSPQPRCPWRAGIILTARPRSCGCSDMPISAGTCGSSWPRSGGWMWPSSPTPPISPPGPWPGRSGRGGVMRKPHVSVLVVARDEADNLADCLAAARWADERVVVVDAASRDATLEIARRDADLVAVRAFDDFASQRNAALGMAT